MSKVYKAKSSAKRAAKAALAKAPEGSLIAYSPDGLSFEIAVPVVEAKEKPEILRKSAMSGACALVWDIAEQGLANGLKRKDIIAQCVEAGVAFYTARTQYQKYTEALRGK